VPKWKRRLAALSESNLRNAANFLKFAPAAIRFLVKRRAAASTLWLAAAFGSNLLKVAGLGSVLVTTMILKSLLPLLCASAVFTVVTSALAAPTGTSTTPTAPLLDIPVRDLEGKETTLKPYAGKVLLIVNVASKCGNTKQYAGLQELYTKYKDQGLVVLGFPCNDFGGQEPGTNEEIKTFCSTKYQVSFPLFDKVHVKSGPEQHPLYAALTAKDGGAFPGDVKWNFGKFLIGRDGKPVKRLEPKTLVTEAEVVKAIEEELAKKG